jgi:hypothetical protein
MWPNATIFSILACGMPTLIYAAREWRHDCLRMTFRASDLDASAVVGGDAAAKDPD